MTKPFFTAEDCDLTYESLVIGDKCYERRACLSLTKANAKVAPLIAENEILKHWKECAISALTRKDKDGQVLTAFEYSIENQKLTEQNRLMKEALEFYGKATRYEERHCAGCTGWAATTCRDDGKYPGERAREALAKCKELEK